MHKIKKHIEIVSSSDPSYSLMNPSTCAAIQQALLQSYEKVEISVVGHEDDLPAIVAKNPDVIFLGMKRIPMRTTKQHSVPYIWLADYFEQAGIACTGSDGAAIKLENNKGLAKAKVLKDGLQTAASFLTYEGRYINAHQLPVPFPLFIKPPSLGGGVGVDDASVVRTFDEYKAKLKSLAEEHDADALVEAYLPGREFTVALLMNDDSSLDAYPMELVAQKGKNGVRVLGKIAKRDDKEEALKVADAELATKLSQFAKDVFVSLGARDYGRIDIRMDEAGVPNFLEANLVPSLADKFGNFPKAYETWTGMPYDTLLHKIINLALNRAKNIA